MSTEDDLELPDNDLLRVGGPVNHPAHYNQHPAGIECIAVIEHMTLNIGTAVKYVWRAGLKPATFVGAKTELDSEIRDLESAIWYIRREIERKQAAYKPGWKDPREGAQ